MTAEERGRVLARLMALEGLPEAGAGARAFSPTLGRLEASEGQREVLVLSEVPSDPNALTPYQWRIVDAIREGATLARGHGNTWRLFYTGGRSASARVDSVQNLRDRGVLREVEPESW